MAGDDYYDSLIGSAYSAYMERPWLSRTVGRAVWGGDTRSYYQSMGAIGEVPAGGTVVDCPCGAGPALRAAPVDGKIRYLAIDLSPSMLRRARRRASERGLSGIEFVEADAKDLPIESGTVDLFVSYWGLHCYKDPAAALTEAARVLKPGGRLVGAALVSGRDHLRQRLLIRSDMGGFGTVGSGEDVERWLQETGFDPRLSSSGPMLFFDAAAD